MFSGGYHVQLYGFILDHCIEPGQHCMVDLHGRAGAWKLELALELINCSYGFIPLFASLTSITAQVDAYNNARISYSIEVRRGVQSRKLCSTVCYFCCKGSTCFQMVIFILRRPALDWWHHKKRLMSCSLGLFKIWIRILR